MPPHHQFVRVIRAKWVTRPWQEIRYYGGSKSTYDFILPPRCDLCTYQDMKVYVFDDGMRLCGDCARIRSRGLKRNTKL